METGQSRIRKAQSAVGHSSEIASNSLLQGKPGPDESGLAAAHREDEDAVLVVHDADVRAVVRGDVRRREDLVAVPSATTEPSFRSTRWSAYWPASVRSCIVVTTVSPSAAEGVDKLEHELLTAEVERRRRLVEQEHRRLLRERAREHGTLQLAAAERAERPLAEALEVEAPQGLRAPPRDRGGPRRRGTGCAACGRGGRTPRPSARAASRASAERRRRAARRRAARAGARPAVDQHLALVGGEAGERAQPRGLPRAVRPDQRRPAARAPRREARARPRPPRTAPRGRASRSSGRPRGAEDDREEGSAEERRDDADRQLGRREDRPRHHVRDTRKPAPQATRAGRRPGSSSRPAAGSCAGR